MYRLIFVCALGLGACAAPRVVWEQPGLDSATAETQREIDSAECMAVAMQTVSLPEAAVESNVTVSVRGFNQSEIASSGQMTATGSEVEAQRLRTAALKEAITERQALNDACMLHRGWVKRGS